MCGIFGYIGPADNAAQIVLEGLRLLEYRGYDSWGISVKVGKNLVVEKHIGKIGNATVNLPKSGFGIGHTRWATHGGVTVENAHPHLDCQKEISVVHNGIVENYEELRSMLIQKGHTFISETDSEVIPHLIEDFLRKEGFATSVRDAFNLLSGLNAIVVAYAPSQQIVAAKTGSPLVVGRSKDTFYIASDITGIIRHTKDVLFLKDNEMIILGKNIELLSLPKGNKISPHFEKITWEAEIAEKGKYKHFMLKEIYDQPKVVLNIAQEYEKQIEELAKKIKNAHGTFFIGAGTAFHATLAGTYFFSKHARVHVNTAVASEFMYLEDFLTKKSLIIALSQSGETIDVIESLNRAKEKGCSIAAITNSLGSSIHRMGDYKLLLGAGPEKAVASTKAYIAKLAVLMMLSFAMAGKIKEGKALLLKAGAEIARLLTEKSTDHIKEIAHVISKSANVYVIGRGVSYPTALEAALKIKEVSYLHTEGLAGGELKHGTIALIAKGTPCIVFAPKDETYESIISNAIEIKARGGLIIGISSQNSPAFDHWIEVRDCGESTVLAQIIPAQLLGYYLALLYGFDPDMPRNLAKSVTVK